MSIWSNPHGRAVRRSWVEELDRHLVDLAAMIKHSRRLRVLRIQAISELPPSLPLPHYRAYLYVTRIGACLSARNLTSLDLDFCGTRFILHRNEEPSQEFQFCTTISALLTTLRCLRLRMRKICPNVLIPRQHGTELRLNKLLINLSLAYQSNMTAPAEHSRCCDEVGFFQLKEDMEKQAQVLAAQMVAPKIVRILTHVLPSVSMRGFDALTGKTIALDKDAEWDDDGEVIED